MFASNLVNVIEHKGDLRVSSREIAEKFRRSHKNVLRTINFTIRNLPNDFNELNFELVEIIRENKIGGHVKEKQYLLSRDAFSLVAMGLNGRDAMNWKIKFLMAFNEMEHVIKEQLPMLKAQIADLQDKLAKRKQLALGPRSGKIPAPVYQETLWGEIEIVRFERRNKNEMTNEEKIEATQMHVQKVIDGLQKKDKDLTIEAGKARRKKQSEIIQAAKK